MATVSAIDAIFANITTGGANTAVEALACWNALKNELYPTPVNQTPSVITIIERNYTSITYNLNFTKGGNYVEVNGTFAVAGGLGSLSAMFDFNSSEYKGRNSMEQYINVTNLQTGASSALLVNPAGSGSIQNIQNLNNGVLYAVNGGYYTNS